MAKTEDAPEMSQVSAAPTESPRNISAAALVKEIGAEVSHLAHKQLELAMTEVKTDLKRGRSRRWTEYRHDLRPRGLESTLRQCCLGVGFLDASLGRRLGRRRAHPGHRPGDWPDRVERTRRRSLGADTAIDQRRCSVVKGKTRMSTASDDSIPDSTTPDTGATPDATASDSQPGARQEHEIEVIRDHLGDLLSELGVRRDEWRPSHISPTTTGARRCRACPGRSSFEWASTPPSLASRGRDTRAPGRGTRGRRRPCQRSRLTGPCWSRVASPRSW